jgi:hypothetical protein
MTTQNQLLPSAWPLTWRSITPWHKKLGARSTRWNFGPSANPVAAAPALVNFRYDAATMDRVIGFNVAWLNPSAATPCDFIMIENNTGWLKGYTYSGTGAVQMEGNLETLPDEISLSFWWTAPLPATVFVSLFNNERVPHGP